MSTTAAMSLFNTASPPDTRSRLDALRAQGRSQAYASPRTSSPLFPEASPRAAAVARDEPLMGSLPSSPSTPSRGAAGSRAVAGGEASAAFGHASELLLQSVLERVERVEQRQQNQEKSAEAERAWVRGAVEGLTGHMDEALGRLGADLRDADSRRASLAAELDAKLRDARAEQTKVSDGHHSFFTRLYVEQRERDQERGTQLGKQLQSLAEELSSQIQMIAERVGHTGQRVDEVNTKFRDICFGLDGKIGQSSEACSQQIEWSATKLAEQLDAVERLAEANSVELEQRITAGIAALSRKFDSEVSDVEDRASFALQTASAETAERFVDLTAELNSLDSALVASKADLEEQVRSEADRLDQRLEQLSAGHAAAEADLAERLDAAAADLDHTCQQSLRKIGALERKSEDFALGAEVKTQRMLSEMRLDELSAAAQSLQGQLDGSLAEIQEVVERCEESVGEFSVDIATMEVTMLSM